MANTPLSKTPRGKKNWLKIALIVISAALAGLAVAYVVLRKPPPEKSPAIRARLELAAGEVMVSYGDVKSRAVSGTALRANAKVGTSPGARALLRLPDGSSSFLRGGSSVLLSDDALLLESGEQWVDVPNLEREALVHRVGEVKVTAVGAGLSIKHLEGGASIYVARGMAVVSAPGGRVEVHAGEQATVNGSDAPKIAPVAFWDDWTGGMADAASAYGAAGAGTGLIYGVDTHAMHGSPARRLEIKRQSVRAVLRDGLSETEVDQTFFNPGGRAVEGWYWFAVPKGASVTSFAVETDGRLVEGEFIEKREAAAKYTGAKRRGHAPAILEWVDGQSYRARIFPVPASGTRRVVLRYIELQPIVDGRLSYVYPMGRSGARIGEFSLVADLGDAGQKMKIATLDEARIEQGGKRITMRRSGYTPRTDFQLEATIATKRATLAVARFKNRGDGADYLMARYTPDVAWNETDKPRADVVVVVDTSADGDEASRLLKAATAEAILRSLNEGDRFALVSLDVRATVLHPAKELAEASDAEIAKALEALATHSAGGATDLASLFDASLGRIHGAEQPAVVYVGDGIATSGEMTGEQLIERLRRALSVSRARLFTMAVGADSDTALLGELARAGGGQSFRIGAAGVATAQALELIAAIKVPTITDFEIDLGAGLDEPFVNVSGKVPQGSDVIVLARTHHDIPSKVKVRGRLAGKPFEKMVKVEQEKGVITAFVPRLWAAAYVQRLLGGAAGPEAERGRITALGVEYGLLTPFTSILALDSEAAYARMGIKRRSSPLRGVRLSGLSPREELNAISRVSVPLSPTTIIGCSKSSDESTPDNVVASKAEPAGRASQEEGEGRVEQQRTQSPAPAATMMANEDDARKFEEKEMNGAAAEPIDEIDADAMADLPSAKGRPAKRLRSIAPKPAFKTGTSSGFGTGKVGGKDQPTELGRMGKADRGGRDQGQVAGGMKKKAAKSPRRYRSRHRRWPVKPKTCSDLARRPLSQRVVMWRKRLRTAKSPQELIARHRNASQACELTDWRAEQLFLRLLQVRIRSEGGATMVLRHFSPRPDVQRFLAKLIMRRTIDKRIVAAVERVVFGNAVQWLKVDLELSLLETADEKIALLRERMATSPDDPNGQIRLVEQLALADRNDEALALGRRLRDRGMLTVRIARQLGDVLARAGLKEEAVRTYSEIVEFDPKSLNSRLLLGDIYLGHSWYGPAYRQYKTATVGGSDDASAWLRLASAAAGNGRVDEALRIERKVASAQGRPGPRDPRRWARLWSAARLSRLLAQPKGDNQPPRASVERKLKELGLFNQGPATLIMLTWQDLRSDVTLVTKVAEKEAALGELVDASPVGMSAALLSVADAERAQLSATLRSAPRQDAVALWHHEVKWDGKHFAVELKELKLPARATSKAL